MGDMVARRKTPGSRMSQEHQLSDAKLAAEVWGKEGAGRAHPSVGGGHVSAGAIRRAAATCSALMCTAMPDKDERIPPYAWTPSLCWDKRIKSCQNQD